MYGQTHCRCSYNTCCQYSFVQYRYRRNSVPQNLFDLHYIDNRFAWYVRVRHNLYNLFGRFPRS